MSSPSPRSLLHVTWQHAGVVLPRNPRGDGGGANVIGDPCIVWDETIGPQGGWRMVLFSDPPGHGQALCRTPLEVGPGRWEYLGPIPFTNPKAIIGGFTHKPWIVQDPQRPNHAAQINGRYCLLTVSLRKGQKVVQRAWAEQLAGPWTLEQDAIITPGGRADFDAKHADTITGYSFPERGELLYYYKGYPLRAQPRPLSPYGAARGAAVERLESPSGGPMIIPGRAGGLRGVASRGIFRRGGGVGRGAAVERLGSGTITKLGPILPPCPIPGHWAAGWVGGLQLLPGASVGSDHRWLAVLNASPTAPDPANRAIWRDEPAPSLGGCAWCDEEWPVQGWQWAPHPFEWIDALPPDALAAGEGVNLWRHHLLVLPDGRYALFYNSGPYGKEQLYIKLAGRL